MRPARATSAPPFLADAGRRAVIAVCAVLALAGVAANLAIGPVAIDPADLLGVLLGHGQPGTENALTHRVVLDLRGPRVVLATAVGAALAVSGAAFQGLFRNPLADPSLLGVSAGAAAGAVAFIVLGHALDITAWLPPMAGLPLSALLGAVLSAALLYLLGRRAGAFDVASLLLTGIALNAVASALSGLLVFASDEQQLRELTFWSLGSLSRAHWSTLLPALPLLAVALAALLTLARAVDALTLGEAAARHLGFPVEKLKLVLVLASAGVVGIAVALSGVIAFVGLIVPHILRSLIGADNRYVFAGSALAGAALMLAADLAARNLVTPAELPIGILTSLLGGPFFLWLMLSRRALASAP